MYNLRFSLYALRLLVEFKRSKELFPSAEQLTLYADMLSVSATEDITRWLAKEAFEYFYSGKAKAPSQEKFEEWVEEWGKQAQIRVVEVEVASKANGLSFVSHVLAVDSSTVDKNSPVYKARQKFAKSLSAACRKNLEIAESLEVNLSEDILLCAETEKPRYQQSLLAFAVKKTNDNQPAPLTRTRVLLPGRIHSDVKTFRANRDIQTPVRMVFFKHHTQIRPPYYHMKPRMRVKPARNSLKRILSEEEYLYNSEDEWVEGEGESISEESSESLEEEEEDQEWIEQDTEQRFIRKGHLPQLDHPVCFEYPITEEAE